MLDGLLHASVGTVANGNHRKALGHYDRCELTHNSVSPFRSSLETTRVQCGFLLSGPSSCRTNLSPTFKKRYLGKDLGSGSAIICSAFISITLAFPVLDGSCISIQQLTHPRIVCVVKDATLCWGFRNHNLALVDWARVTNIQIWTRRSL
jgi:hypothetical protein